ncbi:MAG: tRNA dimethylallyltransferase [Parcubacteria bacterium C7867-005]|nr:MAG: tRNA dimethylallyltransferase [Parcubacteria bacterium C7867-005]
MKPKVLIIVGPTASGKSSLAVSLAKKFNGEIISADSRQVYKGLNIGAGKITKKEMLNIPHHMLDVADPKKSFSASDYKVLGEKILIDILERNKTPIIVGGTGFYIDILIGETNLPEVPPNKVLRERLERKDAHELYMMLQKKDPVRAKSIDSKNKVRLIRALEIVSALGHVPLCQPARLTQWETVFIGIRPEQKDLEEKIYRRLLKRMEPMIKEGKRLHDRGLTWKRMQSLGLEYKYIAMFLQDKIDRQEMRERLYTEIKQYSKRQMTWFKRNKSIKWFESGASKEIEKYVRIAL